MCRVWVASPLFRQEGSSAITSSVCLSVCLVKSVLELTIFIILSGQSEVSLWVLSSYLLYYLLTDAAKNTSSCQYFWLNLNKSNNGEREEDISESSRIFPEVIWESIRCHSKIDQFTDSIRNVKIKKPNCAECF